VLAFGDIWRQNGGEPGGGGVGRRGKGRGRTLTQALAASAFAKRTLATPSGSLSKRTTLVTSPVFEHSSRMSSFMSRIAAGSSWKGISWGLMD